MWNLVEQYKQKKARNRYMPRAHRRSRGTTEKLALLALVLILAASAVLQLRGGSSEAETFEAMYRENSVPGIELIEQASAARRLVFLADVPSAAAPKELAALAIERLARGTGLDVVALEVDAAEQLWIDRYLSTPQEDASILLSRPRLVRDAEGVSRAYTDILLAVRRMNDELGADRRIRVLALDAEGWPPAGALSPGTAAQQFGARDSAMLNAVQEVIASDPKSRMLFFVGGLHALKSGTGEVQTGGTRTVQIQPLASRLRELYPQDVFSILTDATPSRVPATVVGAYRGTAAGNLLRDAGVDTGAGVLVNDGFDFFSNPIRIIEKPGIQFVLTPQDLSFSDVADAYIYLGS